ncbi:MAG: lipocalin family protein [Spirochaetaceae bacterium]|jgi:apolipoprotein D and lipocalin family protein|nr:lipocalin family protein [Spirochaetaceae bacterium]
MKIWSTLALVIFLVSCNSSPESTFHPTVDYVDMEAFSGDWYVIALLPTVFEKNAANGIENYRLDDQGIIRVEYTFRKGSPQGKEKVMYQSNNS